MLKKIGLLVLLLLFTVNANSEEWLKTYTIENDSASERAFYVPTTIIVPNQSKIHGWTVMHSRRSSYSPLAIFWDEKATTTHLISNLIGESEASANSTKEKSFPYPRNISNQVKVILGAYATVIIEYTK